MEPSDWWPLLTHEWTQPRAGLSHLVTIRFDFRKNIIFILFIKDMPKSVNNVDQVRV